MLAGRYGGGVSGGAGANDQKLMPFHRTCGQRLVYGLLRYFGEDIGIRYLIARGEGNMKTALEAVMAGLTHHHRLLVARVATGAGQVNKMTVVGRKRLLCLLSQLLQRAVATDTSLVFPSLVVFYLYGPTVAGLTIGARLFDMVLGQTRSRYHAGIQKCSTGQ